LPDRISLSEWLDPVIREVSEKVGIPTEDASTRIVGEGIGSASEYVLDVFTRGWLNKLIQCVIGLVCTGVSFSPDVDISTRFRKELLTIGMHELLRVVDPKPSDIRELKASIEEFKSAVEKGDIAEAILSGVRPMAEWESVSRMVGIPTTTPVPTPRPKTRTVVGVPTPAPAPKTKGRYTITG